MARFNLPAPKPANAPNPEAVLAQVQEALKSLNELPEHHAGLGLANADVTVGAQDAASLREMAEEARAQGWGIEERALRGPGLSIRFTRPSGS